MAAWFADCMDRRPISMLITTYKQGESTRRRNDHRHHLQAKRMQHSKPSRQLTQGPKSSTMLPERIIVTGTRKFCLCSPEMRTGYIGSFRSSRAYLPNSHRYRTTRYLGPGHFGPLWLETMSAWLLECWLPRNYWIEALGHCHSFGMSFMQHFAPLPIAVCRFHGKIPRLR